MKSLFLLFMTIFAINLTCYSPLQAERRIIYPVSNASCSYFFICIYTRRGESYVYFSESSQHTITANNNEEAWDSAKNLCSNEHQRVYYPEFSYKILIGTFNLVNSFSQTSISDYILTDQNYEQRFACE